MSVSEILDKYNSNCVHLFEPRSLSVEVVGHLSFYEQQPFSDCTIGLVREFLERIPTPRCVSYIWLFFLDRFYHTLLQFLALRTELPKCM